VLGGRRRVSGRQPLQVADDPLDVLDERAITADQIGIRVDQPRRLAGQATSRV
jgi:hypothetical protein